MSNTGYIGSSRSVALYDAPSRSQFEGHLLEEGGIHGIPLNARSIHSEELLNAVSTAATTAEAVSMTGKGAIVESGSDPDGHYVRWENGEQACWRNYNKDLNQTSRESASFPVSFSAQPISGGFSVGNHAFGTGSERRVPLASLLVRTGSSLSNWELFQNDSFDDPSFPIILHAWGFWK